jgi:ribonuclease G
MSKDLVISATRHETRVALLEDDQLVEVYHQRENEYSLAGSIHKGRVTRVLPGMQSAFVDIGLERDAFLYVSDFFEDNEEYDKIVTSVEDQVLKLSKGQQPFAVPAPSAAPAALLEAVPAAIPSALQTVDAPAPVVVLPPSATESASASAPNQEQHRDDRDRRGRRSRRRRGGRGRGLPDSKFYSPDQRGEERTEKSERNGDTAAPEPEPAEESVPRAGAEPADDFFVLPGESLAKYSGPDEDREPEVEAESAPEPVAEHLDPAAARLVEALESDNAPEPEATAAAVASETLVAENPPVKPVETVVEALAVAVEPELVAEEPAEGSVAAEDTEPENGAAVEENGGEIEESASAEDGLAAENGENGSDAPGSSGVADPEGPEPARIPTSLTATLREQGPRYLHRVSRRMRRRGGRDRGDRGPQPAGAEPAARPTPEPEVRTAPAKTADPRAERPAATSISDLLREGQEIIVQIAKEPLGQKGARITSHIALPGRFLVYMPTVDHVGVSRKIPSDEERSRLKRILQSNRTGIPGGYIVRTAGEGRSEEELRADMMFLYNLWLDMRQKAERKPAPALIHHDLNVVERVLRDQLTSSFKNIWVDNEELYEGVLRFVERFQPALVSRVKLYTRSNPIFDEFGITSELEKALRPKVWLKSGGYIVINQTEALVAIDINTGKYVGRSNRLEDTIVKTNTDAIKEIVRQIRLRDLGGIIVVDFIDMDERKNRQKVMQALEEAMRVDRAPYKILQFNDFGLVAITRKRVKQSLERTLCTPCAYCEGAGYVKSPQTIITEILQEARKLAGKIEGKDVLLRVSPDVARLLKSNQNSYLQELEETLGRPVFVKGDSQLHQEKFDLA